ncbi:TPA: zinc-binding dehydrogenase [Burkholderia cepacia ATCC 25416]|nr:zinc-binding dehydrogenase [Burkholderia cepacia ATCC 25416]
MKAAVIRQFGTPDVFSIENVEKPRPGPDDVLIKVLAIGLNRIDHYVRQGWINPELAFPHILGSDISGVIESIGENVVGFKEGDRVIPLPGYPTNPDVAVSEPLSATPGYAIRGVVEQGAYAEYMVVPARWVLHDDTGLTPEEVATLPMKLVTCVQAVKGMGQVKKDDYVLIHAGASGTGSVSIQVAKALGAKVATTLRTRSKGDDVSKLGADLIIDSGTHDFVEEVKKWSEGQGADVVVDNLGGEFFSRSIDALRPLGTLVSMGMVTGNEATIQLVPFFFSQKQIKGSVMGGMEDMRWGLEKVKSGKIKPVIDRIFKLEEISQAHERLAAGDALGTIIVKP